MAMPHENNPVSRFVYLGFAVVALATIVFELLLTRIFSVTIWYHFAFFVISMALFGMTVGAVAVYVARQYFISGNVLARLARFSLYFGITIVFSMIAHFVLRFGGEDIWAWPRVFATYVLMSVPFVMSGICVALILTYFAKHTPSLYAADLVGASLGCLVVLGLLSLVDAPSAVLITAALPCAAGAFFAVSGKSPRLFFVNIFLAVLLVFLGVLHAGAVQRGYGLLHPIWVKGSIEAKPLYEKWNPISRVRVIMEPSLLGKPFGWGLSLKAPNPPDLDQRYISIDANAGTVLTHYAGATSSVAYLRYDIINAVHVLRQHAKVLVVGVGGGRDILSALVFGQDHVTGVEINGTILNVVKNIFGDFTGHLDRDSRVSLINDEARSYLTRTKSLYDIIQISLIDTQAATAAGAYTLTENTLYTREAFAIFHHHLSERGILSVSRWYLSWNPSEAYRLLRLARVSLEDAGVTNPRAHLIMLRFTKKEEAGNDEFGTATLLYAKSAFTESDLDHIEAYAKDMGFTIMLSPRMAENPTVRDLADGVDPSAIPELADVVVSAPTDDAPFFFQTTPLANVLAYHIRADYNVQAVTLLFYLFVMITVLVAVTIILPMRLNEGRFPRSRELPLLVYFMAIGVGFILIEIAEMQRFIVFLGHPTYALSVVLATLLLSAGLGSYLIEKISEKDFHQYVMQRFVLLFCALFLLSCLHPLLALVDQYGLFTRVCIAFLMIFPIGFLMGTFFPVGMRIASRSMPEMIPWFWGVNGGMSVFASVLAPILAFAVNFSFTYWVGVGMYAVAAIVFYRWKSTHHV